MKYICDVCGWEYDEEKGYPEGGVRLVQVGGPSGGFHARYVQ